MPDTEPTRPAITRRQFVVGSAFTLGGIAVAGCADDNDDSASPSAAASATPSTPNVRSFTDSTGTTVEVPNQATRIVATHDYNAGAQLLSLGAPVIGLPVREDGKVDPSLRRYFNVDGITTVGTVYEPNIEAIAALKPDLIVHEAFDGKTQFRSDNTLEQLRQIAPVVAIDTFRTVEDVMADFGRLLGPGAIARMDQGRAAFDETVGRLRALLGDRWSQVTVSVVYYFEGNLRAYEPEAGSENDILNRIGVRWSSAHQQAAAVADDNSLDFSLEKIADFDADLVVLAGNIDSPLEEEDLFQRLDAVEAGQWLRLSSGLYGTHYANMTALAQAYIDALVGKDLRTDII